MKRTIIAAAVASLLTLGVALAAFAQSGALAGLLNPLVVKIQQAVPVELTVATAQEDGSVITSTVPITVGVDLAITIQGSQVVSLTAGAGEPTVAVQALPGGDELVDDSGVPYTLEIVDGLELLDLQTSTDFGGTFAMIGEIRNAGAGDSHYVDIVITLYDDAGKMLAVTSGGLRGGALDTGKSSPFSGLISTPSEEVASYRLQIR